MRRIIIVAIVGVAACSASAGQARGQTPAATGQDSQAPPLRTKKPATETIPLPQTGDTQPLPAKRERTATQATPPVTGGNRREVPAVNRADLVVLGPEVTEVVVAGSDPAMTFYQYSHRWTVHNQGNATAHSTQLFLDCEDNYPDPGETYCSGGAHNWHKTVEIPPLEAGASFEVESSDYGKPMVTVIKKVQPADDADAAAEFEKHWLKFTAMVDPNKLVDEFLIRNNTAELVMANMPAPSKPPSALLKAVKAGKVGAAPNAATVESGAGSLPVAPKYTITTEDPWSPGITTWVLVANSGNYAGVEASVGVHCVNLTHAEYNQTVEEWNAALDATPALGKLKKKKLAESCAFLADQQLPVPALAQGATHPLIQMSTAPLDAEATGFGFGDTPSFDESHYTITFTGPAGDKLVLSTRPPQFKK